MKISSTQTIGMWDVIAIDTGGTFTDVICIRNNSIKVYKLPSTPEDPAEAVKIALKQEESSNEILHGTTVATNAVLERKGAKVGLITTQGFKDIIEIGRQNRDDIYSLYPRRPQPLVPSQFRYELNERINANGNVLIKLDNVELNQLVEKIKLEDFDSIAVSLLFSFLQPKHEDLIGKALKSIIPVSLSSVVLPEYREYERTSTTVMDAYVKPVISNYFDKLHSFIETNNISKIFSVLKSDMGLAKGSSLSKIPVDSIFSGLAGGIKAAEYTSELTGLENLISLDIGGTSTDVAAVIQGKGTLQQSQKIDGLPVARPAVDVVTIGAGGGSLVEFVSGLIKVGPQSAGADPGPVAYGKGGKVPTITDTDLVFGILPEELGGGILDMQKEKALESLQKFADEIGLDLKNAIEGIRRIFHENIAGAIRSVTTQRGHDPRDFSLLCFGGAGPVHAAELAELMKIPQVIIPPYPGTWSAMGLIGSDYVYQSSKGVIKPWKDLKQKQLIKIYEELEDEVKQFALLDNLELANPEFNRKCSMRFIGQSYDLTVPFTNIRETRQKFIEMHRSEYGFAAEDEPVEVVALRASLKITHHSPILPEIPKEGITSFLKKRAVIGIGKIPIFERNKLTKETELTGPVIIEQDDSTIWVPIGWEVSLDKYGFLYLKNLKEEEI